MANNKWTKEKLQIEALKYKSRGEFQKNNLRAYAASCRKSVLDQICSHMPKHIYKSKEDHYNFKWTEEKLQKEALKYKNRGEFAIKNSSAYTIARIRGALDQICSHMKERVRTVENHPRFKWTHKKLQEEALKYKSRVEFKKSSRGAYSTAQNRGALDQICSHMPRLTRKAWSAEELSLEALKYKSRVEFWKNSNSAYTAARKKMILGQICSHMKLSSNISNPEKDLFDVIKSIYPKTQTLRDRKVKIKGKPHIQGFDLDIYVPELRKGIEFDGKYWHNFDVMLKSKIKCNWPKEDIENYHGLKDMWFSNKNIKVIHVKEEDWIKNQQICIDRCLNFLGAQNVI